MLRLPLQPPPLWLPPLTVERAAIVDDIVVTYCAGSMIGKQWLSRPERFGSLVATLWATRFPLNFQHVSNLLVAHGMPSIEIKIHENQFLAAQAALIDAAGRPPIKKWHQNDAIAATWSDAMRFWGRW